RRRRDRRLADRDRIRPGRSGRPARVPDLGDGAGEAPPRPPAGRHRRRRVARRGRPPASGVGGGGIQARGPSRVRVATAAAALALAGALAVASAVTADGPRVGWLWALALIGVAATAVGLAGWAGATWWGVIALGAEYAVLRIGRGPVDVGA